MKRILLQPAYVLHRRPYRETSFLVDLFTRDYGRMTVISKGVRRPRSDLQGLLQPFIPLLVSWTGRSELMTLMAVESQGNVKYLQGECLFAGFYLNELLVYLLEKWDAHTGLFTHYTNTLITLQTGILEQKVLRSFEKYLLEELGYGVFPKSTIALHNTFSFDKYYRFIPDQGFVLNEGNSQLNQSAIFSGKSLLAIAMEDWRDEETLRDGKRLMRLVLTFLLGARPVYSRRLFLQVEEEKKNAE